MDAVALTCTVSVMPPTAPGARLARTAVKVPAETLPVGVADTKV